MGGIELACWLPGQRRAAQARGRAFVNSGCWTGEAGFLGR